jgi:hypothetical protein
MEVKHIVDLILRSWSIFETNNMKTIDLIIVHRQDCFAGLPAGYIYNTMPLKLPTQYWFSQG